MVTRNASPHRVLVLADQPLVVDLISLTLNHGTFVTRDVPTLDDAKTVVAEWQPHVAVIDMHLVGRRPFARSTRRPEPPVSCRSSR